LFESRDPTIWRSERAARISLDSCRHLFVHKFTLTQTADMRWLDNRPTTFKNENKDPFRI
jgi:hypothetical protein